MGTVSFDRAAKYYDRTRGYPPGIPAKIRNAIIQYTKADPTTRFIELGIGTGLVGIPFLESAYNYVGVDISTSMMTQIRTKMSQHSKQIQPQLVQADITHSLPFHDQRFDVATSTHVFHVLGQLAISDCRSETKYSDQAAIY